MMTQDSQSETEFSIIKHILLRIRAEDYFLYTEASLWGLK